MQQLLFEAFQHGGPLAAPPGKSFHHRSSVDLGVRSEAGRAAMIGHGFFDLLPDDPPTSRSEGVVRNLPLGGPEW